MQRLRAVKPTVDMRKPPKPTHIQTNYKREMQKRERLNEIQYENRVLLRKMLQIDLKPSLNVNGNNAQSHNTIITQGSVKKLQTRPQSAKSKGGKLPQPTNTLNSYTSLNRANRIRSLAKIIDENKVLLDKLQSTKSTYDTQKWKVQYEQSQRRKNMITQNSDRFCRNPYFLHSVCSVNAGLPQHLENMSSYGRARAGASSKTSYMPYVDNQTISEYGMMGRQSRRKSRISKQSSQVGTFDVGPMGEVPRIRKRVRPFSAPRHQYGFKAGRQQRAHMQGHQQVMMSHQAPMGVSYARGGQQQEVDQLMEVRDEGDAIQEDGIVQADPVVEQQYEEGEAEQPDPGLVDEMEGYGEEEEALYEMEMDPEQQ